MGVDPSINFGGSMSITTPTTGQPNWDIPLNAALNTLESEIDTNVTGAQTYTDTQIVNEITRADNAYNHKLNNLSDINNVPAARVNLGLGNAATKNVGTTSGTIMAGDDSRVVNALPTGVAAGGDLTGTLPNPTVAKINGISITGTPSIGDIPTATSSTAAHWAPPASAAVTSVAGRTGAVTLVEGDIAGLTADLASKAVDTTVVHKTGTETINGVKTFGSPPVVPSDSFPETAVLNLVSDLASKAVDTTVVHNTGTETIAGTKTFTTAPVVPSGSFPESAVINLTSDLATKAVDTSVVHNTGAESIDGVKTFTSPPVVPSNSFPESAITNLVSDLATFAVDTTVVHNTGNESIAGTKTFTSAPIVPSNSFPESAVTNLVSDLATKVVATRAITAGTGLSGGGDLSADRSFSVLYGTTSGTAAQGNDSRILNSVQKDTVLINAKDHGVAGDGVTVDSTALQAIINTLATAGGGMLYMPAGTYIISNVYLATNITLVGAGMGSTILMMDPAAVSGAVTIRVANGSATAASYVTVRDLTIDGNKSLFTAGTDKKYGYYLGTNTVGLVTDCVVERVEFRNCKTYGLDIVNAQRVAVTDCFSHDNGITSGTNNNASGFEVLADDVTLTNCRATNNANKGFIAGESGTPHQRVKIIGSTAQANSSDGFYFHDGQTDSAIIGCSSRDNLQSGFVFASGSIRNVISGSIATGNVNNGFRMDNSSYISVIGCIADANATGSTGNPEIYLVSGANHINVSTCIVNSVNSSTSIVEHDTSDFNNFRNNIFNKTFTLIGANSTTADSTVVTQVNGHTPVNGAVSVSAADVGAMTQATADATYTRITENVNTVATSGSTQTIPATSVDSISDITLSNNCTLTFPTATSGTSFSLVLRQDGTGGRTTTFPAGIKWSAGTAPTLTTTANAVDVLSFICIAGVWMGFVAGQDVK